MKITRKDLNNVEKDVMHACDNMSDYIYHCVRQAEWCKDNKDIITAEDIDELISGYNGISDEMESIRDTIDVLREYIDGMEDNDEN